MQRARFPAIFGIVDRRFEIRSNIVRSLVYSNVFTSSLFTWAVSAALLGGPMDATAADLALKMRGDKNQLQQKGDMAYSSALDWNVRNP